MDLWNALASVVIAGQDFTADDVGPSTDAVLLQAQRNGWIEPTGHGWRPTPLGVEWAMDEFAIEHIVTSRRAHPDIEIPRLFELES